MKKEIRVLRKDEAEKADVDYWKDKSPEERLDALQYLRELWIEKFHNEKKYHESRKGLRRFYKLTKRS